MQRKCAMEIGKNVVTLSNKKQQKNVWNKRRINISK